MTSLFLKTSFISLFVLLLNNTSYTQVVSDIDSLNKTYINWHLKGPNENKIEGIRLEKTYTKLLKNKNPKKKIVVAVIDSGVDTSHVELSGRIWKNEDEIPNDGIDNDLNGYTDDIYGWNFIGNTIGENLKSENLEYTRIYKKLNPRFQYIKSRTDVAANELEEYKLYIACKEKYNKELSNYQSQKNNIASLIKKIETSDSIIKNYLKKETYTNTDVESISSSDELIKNAKNIYLSNYKKNISLKGIEPYLNHVELYLNKYLNLDFEPRTLLGDNPENINDTKYGNPDVMGPTPEHGTLVAGLIAAQRNNQIGINGIAENVVIMPIRVVPEGDERDKDVALAIRYAVDNGANIINMSFGKAFSPQKEWVDSAIQYATEHHVLLVHASGNDGVNNDLIPHYPSSTYNNGSKAKTMITVGASNIYEDNEFAAVFSNYGKSVDLFAPGVNIVSLYPGNKYNKTNGTSFSCPIVSGIAALIWSYYPDLSTEELKDILLNSVTSYKKLSVYQPGLNSAKNEIVPFSQLSATGGILNGYKAIKLAEKTTKRKK